MSDTTGDKLKELYKAVRNNSRMILYNDPIGRPDEDNRRDQVGRDDMWAISTGELDQFKTLITQAKKDLLAEVREKMYDSHGSCRTASLAAIKEIEEGLWKKLSSN